MSPRRFAQHVSGNRYRLAFSASYVYYVWGPVFYMMIVDDQGKTWYAGKDGMAYSSDEVKKYPIPFGSEYIDCLIIESEEFVSPPPTTTEKMMERKDECRGGSVIEHSCDGDRLVTEVIDCPGGCVNGACSGVALPTTQCTDTDGGINPFVGGQISGGNPITGQRIIKTDECVAEGEKRGRLAEYFCKDNIIASQTFGPEDGCTGCVYDSYTGLSDVVVGVCVIDKFPTDRCFESDGGFDIYNKGYIFPLNAAYGKFDVCSSRSLVTSLFNFDS